MRFACQPGCTDCCTRRGWVYLTEADILRGAEYLQIPPAQFESQYVVRFRKMLRLRRPPRNQQGCFFLKNGGCSIHPAKPTQCRTYPFWPSLISSKAAWKMEGLFCPGIGKGPLIQIERARVIAEETTRSYPSLRPF